MASKAKLTSLRAADDLRRETSQAKNELESYILKVKQGWALKGSSIFF